jgi:GNAT superfamily N-acetyltransferase
LITAHLATWDDPGVAALRTAQQAELRALYGDDDIGHGMTGDGVVAMVVLRDGEVAVACGALRAAPELGAGTGELKRMYVVPSHRGQGLARRVLDEVEVAAPAHGMSRLVLETGALQASAIGLYLGAGYVPIDRFPPYEDETTSRCLAKDLPEHGDAARARHAGLPDSTRADVLDEARADGVAGLVVDRLAWMDDEAVELRRLMAETLRGFYGPVGYFANDETLAAADRAEAGRSLVVLVARDGREALGTLSLSAAPEGRPADWGELERLLVLPAARRQGVARLLLQEAEAEARERGLSTLTLSTGYRQLPAMQLYLSSGYRIVAPAGDAWPRQGRLYWFAKPL